MDSGYGWLERGRSVWVKREGGELFATCHFFIFENQELIYRNIDVSDPLPLILSAEDSNLEHQVVTQLETVVIHEGLTRKILVNNLWQIQQK